MLLLNIWLSLPTDKTSLLRGPSFSSNIFTRTLVLCYVYAFLLLWIPYCTHTQWQTDIQKHQEQESDCSSPWCASTPDFWEASGPKVCSTIRALIPRLIFPLQAFNAQPETFPIWENWGQICLLQKYLCSKNASVIHSTCTPRSKGFRSTTADDRTIPAGRLAGCKGQLVEIQELGQFSDHFVGKGGKVHECRTSFNCKVKHKLSWQSKCTV